MKLLTRFILSIVTPITALSGCYDISEYSGDGTLIDNGIFAATDRYVLNFESIDLNKKKTISYKIRNLPKGVFVVGIDINTSLSNQSVIQNQKIKPVISLELTKSDGQSVFTKTSSLDKWTWSVPSNKTQSFIYGRGNPGTFFQALPEAEYILTLTILEPENSKVHYTAKLMAKSGGWK